MLLLHGVGPPAIINNRIYIDIGIKIISFPMRKHPIEPIQPIIITSSTEISNRYGKLCLAYAMFDLDD